MSDKLVDSPETPEVEAPEAPKSLNDIRAIEDVKLEIITSITETLGKDFMKKTDFNTSLAGTLPTAIHSYMGEYQRKMVNMSAKPLETEKAPPTDSEIATAYLKGIGIIKEDQ